MEQEGVKLWGRCVKNELDGRGRATPEPWKAVPTTRTQLGTLRSQNRTVLSWEPEAIIQPPHVYRDKIWPEEQQGNEELNAVALTLETWNQ